MIFNSKYTVKHPEHGEGRTVRRFAWRPHRIGSQVVWLGWYLVAQGFFYMDYIVNDKDAEGGKVGFRVGRWVDLSEKIK